MKKILALVLALLFCIAPLASCQKGEDEEKLVIVSEEGCNLIYDPSFVEKKWVESLADAIEEATGVTPTLYTTTYFLGGVRLSEGDILVGQVDTACVTEALAALRYKDYFCGVSDLCYVIAGFSEETTRKAIEHFVAELLPLVDEAGTLALGASQNYHFVESYRFQTMTVGGLSVENFEIVTPDLCTGAELRTALYMQYIMRARSGYTLPIVTESESNREGKILVGASLCEDAELGLANSYAVWVKGTTVRLAAESFTHTA